MATWDRLTALDASFLGMEDGNAHMHIGGVMLLEPGDLVTEELGLDIDRVRRAVAAKLHLVPRYRQKVAFVRYEGHPVWIDDERFNLDYHVRLTALPHPGDFDCLKRLTGRVMSQQLERGKPLWELWCVEGLADGGFALISKTHHCMVDGISGSDIISTILDWDPDMRAGRPQLWTPRQPPHPVDLAVDALRFRLEQQADLVRGATRALWHPRRTMRAVREGVESIVEAAAPGLQKASATPFNVPIGPHRIFEGLDMPLDEIKAVKNALGGTVNDVVLATVAGGIRAFLEYRREPVARLDNFRAMVPVSVRGRRDAGTGGNRVTAMVAPLPITIADPVERLGAVRRAMEDLKEGKSAVGAEALIAVSEWTVPNVLAQAGRAIEASRPFNLVVTNVPGPQRPLYLEGARMKAAYPVVPLAPHTAVGIALYSYDGTLFWGLNGDWDAMPDLRKLAGCLKDAFAELRAAAEPVRAAPKAGRTRKKAASKKRPPAAGARRPPASARA